MLCRSEESAELRSVDADGNKFPSQQLLTSLQIRVPSLHMLEYDI